MWAREKRVSQNMLLKMRWAAKIPELKIRDMLPVFSFLGTDCAHWHSLPVFRALWVLLLTTGLTCSSSFPSLCLRFSAVVILPLWSSLGMGTLSWLLKAWVLHSYAKCLLSPTVFPLPVLLCLTYLISPTSLNFSVQRSSALTPVCDQSSPSLYPLTLLYCSSLYLPLSGICLFILEYTEGMKLYFPYGYIMYVGDYQILRCEEMLNALRLLSDVIATWPYAATSV